MQPDDVGRRLKDFLLSQGVACDAGVSQQRIAEFEHRNNVRMPPDFKSYFTTMNGTAGGYGSGIVRFWDLDDVKSVADEIPGDTPPMAAVIQSAYDEPIDGAADYFVFADASHEIQLYAIHLSPSGHGQGEVVLLDGSQPIRVSDTFAQFIDLYINSPGSLRLSVD
jgi:hypothetical protein